MLTSETMHSCTLSVSDSTLLVRDPCCSWVQCELANRRDIPVAYGEDATVKVRLQLPERHLESTSMQGRTRFDASCHVHVKRWLFPRMVNKAGASH